MGDDDDHLTEVFLEFGKTWRGSHLPSGKRLHCYGKSAFLMGKSTINHQFSIAMLVYQRVRLLSTPRQLMISCCIPCQVRTSAHRLFGAQESAATHDVRGGHEWSKANRLVKRKEQAGI